MTFDAFIEAAWNDHGDRPAEVADRLEASTGIVATADQIAPYARLATHVLGEHLGEWERGGARSAKRLLYVLRTALTGAHALRSGRIVADLTELLDEYGFAAARELIAVKRSGERSDLPPAASEHWRGEIARAFATLEAARDASPLPEEPPPLDELEAWLIELRRKNL